MGNCWEDAAKFPLLSPEEEIDLARRIREGDEKAFQKMVCCNMRLVVSIASRSMSFSGPSLTFSDLVQEGAIGLIKAVRKFDHRLGFRFSTYATYWIRQTIIRSIHDTSRIIRLPPHVVESLMRIEKTRCTLTTELERSPDTAEVAYYLGIRAEKVLHLSVHSVELASLECMLEKDDEGKVLEDFLEDLNAPSPIDSAIKTIDHERACLILRQAVKKLPQRHARVLRLRYGLDGKKRMTLKEVAKHMSLTPERVRQLHKEARKELRTIIDSQQLFVD